MAAWVLSADYWSGSYPENNMSGIYAVGVVYSMLEAMRVSGKLVPVGIRNSDEPDDEPDELDEEPQQQGNNGDGGNVGSDDEASTDSDDDDDDDDERTRHPMILRQPRVRVAHLLA